MNKILLPYHRNYSARGLLYSPTGTVVEQFGNRRIAVSLTMFELFLDNILKDLSMKDLRDALDRTVENYQRPPFKK